MWLKMLLASGKETKAPGPGTGQENRPERLARLWQHASINTYVFTVVGSRPRPVDQVGPRKVCLAAKIENHLL